MYVTEKEVGRDCHSMQWCHWWRKKASCGLVITITVITSTPTTHCSATCMTWGLELVEVFRDTLAGVPHTRYWRSVASTERWRCQCHPLWRTTTGSWGVNLSDQLIDTYSSWRKSRKWYLTVLHHFSDIAVTNSYLLHKELCGRLEQQPMTHQAFQEQLTAELCGVPSQLVWESAGLQHLPVAICEEALGSKKATQEVQAVWEVHSLHVRAMWGASLYHCGQKLVISPTTALMCSKILLHCK